VRPRDTGHEHLHFGTCGIGLQASFKRNTSAEMAARHDHWNPPGNVVQAKFKQGIAFLVGEQELLGVVCEDADAVHTLIDHTVQPSSVPADQGIHLR
jgi:hypothetical protein